MVMVVHYSLACGRCLFLANSGDVAVVGRMSRLGLDKLFRLFNNRRTSQSSSIRILFVRGKKKCTFFISFMGLQITQKLSNRVMMAVFPLK